MYVNCTWIHKRYTCNHSKTWNLSWCFTYWMDINFICITVFCLFGICITSHSIQQCNYLECWYIVFIDRSLSFNQISQIDNNAFQGLSQLTTLWVKTKIRVFFMLLHVLTRLQMVKLFSLDALKCFKLFLWFFLFSI